MRLEVYINVGLRSNRHGLVQIDRPLWERVFNLDRWIILKVLVLAIWIDVIVSLMRYIDHRINEGIVYVKTLVYWTFLTGGVLWADFSKMTLQPLSL